MRITALSSLVAIGVLGVLALPAQADRKRPLAASRELAALVKPPPTEHSAPTLTMGELGLTATTHLVRPSPEQTDGDVAAPARSERPERYLTTGDVTDIVAPHAAEIERCYVDALGASHRGGKLDLMFVIARDGHVVSLDSSAPGVSVVAAHRLHACLRTAVETLEFPMRRNDTTAIVPYYFQRTDAPNAGPQLSCWNPRGC